MGMRKLGDTITFDFTTHNPSTGMVQDADSLPTCKVFEDDNDSAILTPTVVKRVSETGDYRVSVEATTGNGFEVGKTYNVVASATVNTMSAKSRIGIFVLDSKRNADMNDLSQAQILSDATPFAGANIDDTISSRSTLTADGVWGYSTRELTSFGTLVADIWAYSTRALTTFGTLVSDVAVAVWGAVIRTLTSGTRDSEIDAIKAKTDTILWTDVTEIKTKSDQLNFTIPGRVDATASGGGGGLTPEEHDQVMMIEPIKDKTDQLTFTVAGRVDATASGSGGGLTPEEHDNVMMIEGARDHILEIYALYGLDPTKPLIVTPTLRQAGTILQKITTKPKEVKVERQ